MEYFSTQILFITGNYGIGELSVKKSFTSETKVGKKCPPYCSRDVIEDAKLLGVLFKKSFGMAK